MSDNNLTTTSSQANKEKASEPAYLRLWRRLKILREDNLRSFQHLRDIAARFESSIKPLELQLTKCIYDQCDVLIDHYESTELDAAELSLLGLWITEHQATLGEHPFAQHLPLEKLYQRWQSVLTDGDTAIDKHLASFAASSHEKTQAKRDARGDASSSGNHSTNKNASAHSAKVSSKKSGDAVTDGQQDFNGKTDAKAKTSSKKASKAMESFLSVEKIFRKLAHTLHPDREQLESRKLEKDKLMRECLEARDNDDIAALLMLYEQHIGSVEQLLGDSDLTQLEAMLKREISELQSERLQLQSTGTLQSHILERYRSDSHTETDRRFNEHSKKLQQQLKTVAKQTLELQTDKGLTNALQQRREVELDRMVIRELTGSATS